MFDWIAPGLLFLAGALVLVVTYRFLRGRLRTRGRSAAIRAIRRFEVRLDRYKLVDRRRVREELVDDPRVAGAIIEHADTHGLERHRVETTVREYIDEIIPFFNVLSYYRIGYNAARLIIRLLYRVNARFRDDAALKAIPRDDVVVYAMNHRSNADYVVVAYVLAGRVSISYAVGEWARVWPLEYIFKSFGAYFVRRRYREPLYHTVLERYVQLITRNGVTQGIFLEGGLTRDGRLRDPKLGLLDYVTRTLADPQFTRDIWVVPVALNYDRVLEDRTLTRELAAPADRPGRLHQFRTVARFAWNNLVRAITGNLKRYGRVSVAFGTPRSLRTWTESQPEALHTNAAHRLPVLERFTRDVMTDIASIMPITPVPLVAAALLSLPAGPITETDLLQRLDDWRNLLLETGGEIEDHLSAQEILDRALIMLRMRRLVVKNGSDYSIPPEERTLLTYYANSITHLLPGAELN